jgi:branched-chain amino acid transport system permease protein
MTGTALAAASRAIRLRPSREAALPALIFLAFALLPLLASLMAKQYLLDLAACVIVFAVAAVALDLLVSYAGLTSFDHAVFVGLAAYAVEFLSAQGIDDALVSLTVAIAVSMLFAWLTGIVCLRTKGAYFIRITLALGQMIYFIATSLAPFGGDNGLTIAARNSVAGLPLLKHDRAFYYVALICALATYLFCRALVASRFGPLLVLVVLFACGGLIGLSAQLWRWFDHA